MVTCTTQQTKPDTSTCPNQQSSTDLNTSGTTESQARNYDGIMADKRIALANSLKEALKTCDGEGTVQMGSNVYQVTVNKDGSVTLNDLAFNKNNEIVLNPDGSIKGDKLTQSIVDSLARQQGHVSDKEPKVVGTGPITEVSPQPSPTPETKPNARSTETDTTPKPSPSPTPQTSTTPDNSTGSQTSPTRGDGNPTQRQDLPNRIPELDALEKKLQSDPRFTGTIIKTAEGTQTATQYDGSFTRGDEKLTMRIIIGTEGDVHLRIKIE